MHVHSVCCWSSSAVTFNHSPNYTVFLRISTRPVCIAKTPCTMPLTPVALTFFTMLGASVHRHKTLYIFTKIYASPEPSPKLPTSNSTILACYALPRYASIWLLWLYDPSTQNDRTPENRFSQRHVYSYNNVSFLSSSCSLTVTSHLTSVYW